MHVVLRPVNDNDEGFLLQIYASTREEEVAAWGWPASQRDAFLQMQFRAQQNSYRAAYPAADYSLILADGVTVGRLIVSRQPEQILLVDISILPDYRNRGIGTKLIGDLSREAEAADGSLALQVTQSNRAISLYQRLGFKVVGANEMYRRMELHHLRNQRP
jgi:ribosomal protein S18 acetylase RimI-like enzyme